MLKCFSFLKIQLHAKKRIEDVSAVPIPTHRDDQVLAVTGGGSTGRSQDMGAWLNGISDSFRRTKD
jgi:hypothetical protein